MRYSLQLLNRPTSATEVYQRDLTQIAPDWQRSTHYIYGYKVGSFSIDPVQMTRQGMMEFYNDAIGCTVRERTQGMVSWEGLIVEMHLTLDGVEFMRSLNPNWWHNKVQVIYSDNIGSRASAAWSENTTSSDMYGETQFIVSLAGATSDSATAMRDRHLTEYAWPRSRMIGSVTSRYEAQNRAAEWLAQVEAGRSPTPPPMATNETQLHVTVAGYWATLNWRYRETSESAAASTLITTLVGESEFVTAGRISTNSLSVRVDAEPAAKRLGDAIESIILQGDASGNIWQGGVYSSKQLVYEQAPTTVDYTLKQGRLFTADDNEQLPTLVKPGILVRNQSAPVGWPYYGTGNVWDDAKVGYVEEVEFKSPDSLTLKLHGQEESISTLTRQITAGTG